MRLLGNRKIRYTLIANSSLEGARHIWIYIYAGLKDYTPKEIDLGEYMEGKMEVEEVSYNNW